jgi:acyl-CoA reductase-like NAD-dependent aldehyde dehydrogenase
MVRSYDRIYINGEWVAPSSAEKITVINPATEEACAHVPAAKEADIDRAVAAAREAFDSGPWPNLSIASGKFHDTISPHGFIVDFCAPFGGFKASGVGREFGPEGIASYTEPKSVAIFE